MIETIRKSNVYYRALLFSSYTIKEFVEFGMYQ
jgi:hypothetical protein